MLAVFKHEQTLDLFCTLILQANVLCTTTRAKKIVAGLTTFAMVAEAINFPCWYVAQIIIIDSIYAIVFRAIVPAAILIINVMVVREVRRRTSNDAANNLGVQHHQQSNSAVPTIMLITTSLVYVLLCGMASILYVVIDWTLNLRFRLDDVVFRYGLIAYDLSLLVFA